MTFQQNYSKFGICLDCEKKKSNIRWCEDCEVNTFKKDFENWTSGDLKIDDFIKHTQLNATGMDDYLEYIDFEQFDLVENTNKKGTFSPIYSALWTEGPRWIWDEAIEQWTRNGPIKVALKQLHDSQKMSEEYLNNLYEYHHCLQNENLANLFGITKDSDSNYMFVMRYYENQDLHSYLDEAQGMICWRDILQMLRGISEGIEAIHEFGLIHGNLHGGNILVENELDSIDTRVADVGLHGPVDKKNSNERYGVLPYVAPEILKGNSPTMASDIYSFGIIMWTLSAGIRPWCDRPHDSELAGEIYRGLRPEVIDGTPDVYIRLMRQCWHSNPSKRPTASQLNELMESWVKATCDELESSELSDQFDLAEEKKFSELDETKFHQPEIHPQAFYTSRLLHFPELIWRDDK